MANEIKVSEAVDWVRVQNRTRGATVRIFDDKNCEVEALKYGEHALIKFGHGWTAKADVADGVLCFGPPNCWPPPLPDPHTRKGAA
jgi:hypothetical protein